MKFNFELMHIDVSMRRWSLGIGVCGVGHLGMGIGQDQCIRLWDDVRCIYVASNALNDPISILIAVTRAHSYNINFRFRSARLDRTWLALNRLGAADSEI